MATEVRYKLGTTLIGTGTVAPDYAFNWTNAPQGSHAITAELYVDGVLHSSDLVNVTVVEGVGTQHIAWTNLTDAVDEGNGTISAGTTGGIYGSGGYATKKLNGDNSVIFEVPAIGALARGGIALDTSFSGSFTSNSTWQAMDIYVAVSSDSTKRISIYEEGASVFSQPENSFSTGDTVELRLTGTTVEVLHNSTVIYTSPKVFTLPLKVISLCWGESAYPDSAIINARFKTPNNLIAL